MLLNKKKPSVMLGLPTGDYFMLCKKTSLDMVHMVNHSHVNNVVSNLPLKTVSSPSTERNRTAIAEFAVEEGVDYMMQIDMDMSFPKDALERLLETANHYKDPVVVSGMGFMGAPPYNPAIYKYGKPAPEGEPTREIFPVYDWPDTPFEVDAIGSFGFIVPKEILEAIPRGSWFVHSVLINQETGESREVRHDFSFCKRVTQAGFKIICDPRVKFGHLRVDSIGEEYWKHIRPPSVNHPDFLEGCRQFL